MKTNTNIEQSFRARIQERMTSSAKRWYDMNNKDGDVAEVRIYDEISYWGISADDFAAELDEISAPEILVMINSPGGNVFDGVAIYNALRAHPARVTTRVDGIAASIASVIAQAGDHRVVLTGAQMMIHEAWGLAIGGAEDMREYADLLDRQNENIAGIYARRGGKDKAHFRELMTNDKWFDADETVDEGLADEVVDLPPNEATAKVSNEVKTLHDEVEEATDVVSSAIESAQRVAALRAEKGKELSHVNRTSLDELADQVEQLRALLEEEEQGEEEQDPAGAGEEESTEDLDAALQQEFLKYVAVTTNQGG